MRPVSLRARLRLEVGRRCQVLSDVAKRLVDRDLLVILASRDAPGEDLADLSDDMAVVDEARVARDRQLGALCERARPVIGDLTRPGDERGIDLDRAEHARPDQVYVRPRLDPFGKQHGFPR